MVYARDLDFSASPDLFGLYSSRRAALETLKKIADERQLCYNLLGLESHSKTAPASAPAQAAAPAPAAAKSRSATIMAVCWRRWRKCASSAGRGRAVALVEEGPKETQMHIIHNWFYLGSVSHLDEAKNLTSPPKGFDNDGYKYLCRPLLSGKYPVIPL